MSADGTSYVTAHIIDNSEVGITECGLLIAEPPVLTDEGGWETGPFSMGQGRTSVAIWDDFEIPDGHLTCVACSLAYQAARPTSSESRS